MPQQQQSNNVKPQKIGSKKVSMSPMKKDMKTAVRKSVKPMIDRNAPGMDAMPKTKGKVKMMSATKKTSSMKKAPSYEKVSKSVRKTMGY